MKVGVLTSSRADFGIYIPLLNQLENDGFFDLHIIAFGTHLSEEYGYTITEIQNQGYNHVYEVETMPDGDKPEAIALGIAKTVKAFAKFWERHSFDLIVCLGDRFEMFAAVSAASPFSLNIAHIHAGETTLGAIDNAYRHAISLFAKQLFVSNEIYARRAKEIVNNQAEVHVVGALSIDNLSRLNFLSPEAILNQFDVDINKPSILSTFHPETVAFESNREYVQELINSFEVLRDKYQIIITLPNADTMGRHIRKELLSFAEGKAEVIVIESFGMLGYLSVMKYCNMMLGNTSSGFVEASFFPKPVINIGNRQQGRLQTPNIWNCAIKKDDILSAVKEVEQAGELACSFPYGKGDAAKRIVEVLKRNYEC